jgi:hypothetical protein
MTDVSDLNEQEKVFLAGAIKALILDHGAPTQQELDDLDRIVDQLGFHDFDEHLERFEVEAPEEGDLEYLARNIFHGKAKTLITRILWDLALQKGFASPDDEILIKNIRQWWKE